MLKFLYLCGKKDNEVLWYAMQAAAIKKCNQYKKQISLIMCSTEMRHCFISIRFLYAFQTSQLFVFLKSSNTATSSYPN